MLEIVNERGEILELEEKTAIPVERNNSLFNENNELFLDVSYPGKAPLTAKNKKFFSHGHRVETRIEEYEFEVLVYGRNGNVLYGGVLRYKFLENGYDFVIKPNYNAVSEKAKKYRFRDIAWGDAFDLPNGWNETNFEDYMKDTCLNPDNHPASYLPLKNEKSSNITSDFRGYANFYDKTTQRFVAKWDFGGYTHVVDVPFFRLNYVIEKAMAFLGFRISNDFIYTPEFKNRYLYNTMFQMNRFVYSTVLLVRASLDLYLPQELTVSEFLKAIKDRFKLCLDFDFVNKTVEITSFSSIYNSTKVNDISKYAEEVKEIDIPEQKGFRVFLSPDSTDERYLKEVDGNSEAYPEKALLIGAKQDKVIEIAMGTLHQESEGNFTVVSSKQPANFTQKLRTVIFNGFQTVSGVSYPSVYQDELSEEDYRYFGFLNSSKKIKLIAYLPVFQLLALKISEKIQFTSKEGGTSVCIIERISYDLNSNSRIKCEFILRHVSFIPSNFQIVPGFNPDTDVIAGMFIMSTFDKQKNGFNTCVIEIWKKPYTGNIFKLKDIEINKPFDKYGTGDGEKIYVDTQNAVAYEYFQIRIFTGNPLYVEAKEGTNATRGKKYSLSNGSGYKYANVPLNTYRVVY